MCLRVMRILIHEVKTSQPRRREFDKDAIWEEACKLYSEVSEYFQGLKDKVFQELAKRKDIEDLGSTIRITDHGEKDPKYQPDDLFLH